MERQRIATPPKMLEEISRKSDDLFAWLKEREAPFVGEHDEAVLLTLRGLLARFPRLVAEKKQRNAADPFVIALAQRRGVLIVTEERPTNNLNRPNIPDVCTEIGVRCEPLLHMIREERWLFT